jgi:hypothetical protein
LLGFEIGTSGPSLRSSIDLSYLEGDIVSLVTNNDASRTVIGVRHPVKGGYYAAAPEATLQLKTASNPGPVVFNSAANTFYFSDEESRRIVPYDGGNAEPLTFSGEPEPLADPVGLAVSADGQRLFVAGGSDRVIREYDLRSRALLFEIPLDLTPQRLSPLARVPSVYVLSARTSREQPVWLLDTRIRRSVSFAPDGE